MIQIIVFTIAAYTIPRLLSMVLDKDESNIVQVFAVIGLAGTVLICAALILGLYNMATSFPDMNTGF